MGLGCLGLGLGCLLGCEVHEGGSPIEATAPSTLRIHDGDEAQSCQWPSTVALLDGGGSIFCTGTLIRADVVLTAAHCIELGQVPTTMGFGENAFAPERSVGVQDCTVHPEFGSGLDVDLAVCRLTEAVPDVQPVPILMGCEQEVLDADPEVLIAGYGNEQTIQLDDFQLDSMGAGPKRWVAQEIYEVRDAAQEVDMVGVGVDAGACHGDSGGPAFVQLADGSWRLLGVAQGLFYGPSTPWDKAMPEPGEPLMFPVCGWGTTYTLIAPQIGWLESVLEQDVSACFSADGEWDPGEGCAEFPLALDQSMGDWATGCVGPLGGEPQCGALGGDDDDDDDDDADESGSDGSDESGSPAGDDDDDDDDDDDNDDDDNDDDVAGGETGDDDSASAGEDDDAAGCSCNSSTGGPSMLGWALVLIGLPRRRSRGRAGQTLPGG